MKYDLLLSFGCSFTEGGGLNAPDYHRYLNSNIDLNDQNRLNDYMSRHSYPFYLSKLLGCDFINFGTSCASNDYIFQKTYNECLKYENKKIIVTVQTSILSRILLHSSEDETQTHVNNYQNYTPQINDFYKTYLKHFYNEKCQFDKLIYQVDLLQAWLKSKQIDFVFVAWETFNKLPESQFISFPAGDGSIKSFSDQERLLIAHLPNITFLDKHLSEKGNQRVAEIIFKNAKNKYD